MKILDLHDEIKSVFIMDVYGRINAKNNDTHLHKSDLSDSDNQ